MTRTSPLLNVMIKAAESAARSLIRDFGEVEQLQVSVKSPGDFVSAADTRSEEILYRELQKARPGFSFLMEESGEREGTDPRHTWIIDPLDGTRNFLHGLPHWAISIALQKDKEIVAGVIFDPVKNETYYAEKGAGAFIGNRRLRVSGRKRLNEALIAGGSPDALRSDQEVFINQTREVLNETNGFRRMGAASLDLAYVAAGRYEAFWEYELSPWDVAAGYIIIREAGGIVKTVNGKGDPVTARSVLATNGHIHQDLEALLKKWEKRDKQEVKAV